MKIRKLQLKNIGVFDDETIEFQPCPVKNKAEIHIFTGQNGSGKTTMLMTLANAFNDFSREDRDNSFYRRVRRDDSKSGISEKNEVQIWFDDGSSVGFSEDLAKNKDINVVFHFQSPPISEKLKSYINYQSGLNILTSRLEFAAFTFSGYRQLKFERIEALFEPKEFNPLSQSLNFTKDYNQPNQLTINQLIANNISKSAIESNRNKEKSARFALVVKSMEQIIFEITGWKIEFDLQTEPINLVVKLNDDELDLDTLPDGLSSLISWLGDLLGRIDLLYWKDNLPIFEKNLILFLDEIEVHLHPAWQRKLLPTIQKYFKNSQIFISTHSPFVVNSVDDAWVYKFDVTNGKAKLTDTVRSEDGVSYQTVLSEIFDVNEEFGGKTQDDLNKFYRIVRNGKEINEDELETLAKSLAEQSDELNAIIQIEIRQFNKRTHKNISI